MVGLVYGSVEVGETVSGLELGLRNGSGVVIVGMVVIGVVISFWTVEIV